MMPYAPSYLMVAARALASVTPDEVAQVTRVAQAHGMLASDPAPGALTLVAGPAHESPGIRYAQCGVVIAAERDRASRLPGHGRHQVQVAWGIVAGDGRPWGVETRHRIDTARGDCFVHWWNLPNEHARQGAAA